MEFFKALVIGVADAVVTASVAFGVIYYITGVAPSNGTVALAMAFGLVIRMHTQATTTTTEQEQG